MVGGATARRRRPRCAGGQAGTTGRRGLAGRRRERRRAGTGGGGGGGRRRRRHDDDGAEGGGHRRVGAAVARSGSIVGELLRAGERRRALKRRAERRALQRRSEPLEERCSLFDDLRVGGEVDAAVGGAADERRRERREREVDVEAAIARVDLRRRAAVRLFKGGDLRRPLRSHKHRRSCRLGARLALHLRVGRRGRCRQRAAAAEPNALLRRRARGLAGSEEGVRDGGDGGGLQPRGGGCARGGRRRQPRRAEEAAAPRRGGARVWWAHCWHKRVPHARPNPSGRPPRRRRRRGRQRRRSRARAAVRDEREALEGGDGIVGWNKPARRRHLAASAAPSQRWRSTMVPSSRSQRPCARPQARRAARAA